MSATTTHAPSTERLGRMLDTPHKSTEAEYVTVEDFLRIEAAREERHEYVAGVLYAMVGGTKRHNRIIK